MYKNGAVVCHLDLNHPDVLEFIQANRAELPWVKRCVNINDYWWEEATPNVKQALLQGIRQGDIWLNKTKIDAYETESVVTSALRFTCRHEELACCSMSISLPVTSKTSHRLSLKVCPNCAVSIAEQALKSLVSTCHPTSTDKSDWECSALPTCYEGTE